MWSCSPTICEAIAQELVRGDFLDRTHIGLDYFDASINRVAAWVIGTRNMLKALLTALLEPIDRAARARSGRRLHRPAGAARRTEGCCRSAPCGTTTARSAGAPVGGAWLDDVRQYERQVLAARG